MNVIQIENAYQQQYTAVVLNATKQKWVDNNTYNFIGTPKKQHLLLCFLNCAAVYTLKDGRQIVAPRHSVVYAPEECEYKVRFMDCDETERYNCIGINFRLYDDQGNPFCFENDIKVYTLKHTAHLFETFHEIAESFQFAVHTPMKTAGLFYILLSEIGGYYHEKRNILPKYMVISKAISALESSCVNEINMRDLAKMCNVSTTYFRKLFKEYSGVTPVDYKLNALLVQAKQALLYSSKPVSEIAEDLGFSSATYFCRVFKKKTGMTPMQYKQMHI